MSWADRTPPPMPSVEMPDVAAWERDAEMERECAYFEDGLDPLADTPNKEAAGCAVTAIGPEWSSQSGRRVSERIDYDHQAALTGSLR